MNQIIENKYKLDQAKFLEKVHVFAPATVANMICGYDILGFAVDYPGDEVIMKKTEKLRHLKLSHQLIQQMLVVI